MQSVDLEINPDDLTLGDLEDFEDIVGTSIDDAIKPVPVHDDNGERTFDEKGRPVMTVKVPTKAIIALVYLSERKKHDGYTLDDARKVRVGSLILKETPNPKAN